MTNKPSSHLPALDWFRGLVVIFMIITHTSRMTILDDSWLSNAFKFFLQIEPFTASAFLFISGISLRLSLKNSESNLKWKTKIFQRAIGLYLIGVVLFSLQFGPQINHLDFWIAPNILGTIGGFLIGGMFLVSRPKMLTLTILLILGTTFLLEKHNVPGINTGPGGIFPLWAMGYLGILITHLWINKSVNSLRYLGIITALSWIFSYPWTATYSSFYTLNFPWMAKSNLFAWNLTAIGGIKMFSLLIFCFLLITHSKIKDALNEKLLLLLGRHSLMIYLLHLGILSILSITKIHPPSYGGWIVVVILILICAAVSKALEKLRLN